MYTIYISCNCWCYIYICYFICFLFVLFLISVFFFLPSWGLLNHFFRIPFLHKWNSLGCTVLCLALILLSLIFESHPCSNLFFIIEWYILYDYTTICLSISPDEYWSFVHLGAIINKVVYKPLYGYVLSLGGHMFSFSLAWNHFDPFVSICYNKLSDYFSKAAIPFYILTSSVWEFFFSKCSRTLVIWVFFSLAILNRYGVVYYLSSFPITITIPDSG